MPGLEFVSETVAGTKLVALTAGAHLVIAAGFEADTAAEALLLAVLVGAGVFVGARAAEEVDFGVFATGSAIQNLEGSRVC